MHPEKLCRLNFSMAPQPSAILQGTVPLLQFLTSFFTTSGSPSPVIAAREHRPAPSALRLSVRAAATFYESGRSAARVDLSEALVGLATHVVLRPTMDGGGLAEEAVSRRLASAEPTGLGWSAPCRFRVATTHQTNVASESRFTLGFGTGMTNTKRPLAFHLLRFTHPLADR